MSNWLSPHQHADADENYRARYERLLRTIRSAGLDTWVWDKETDTITYPDTDPLILEYHPRSFTAFYEAVHPDDRQMVRQTIERAIAAAEPFEHIYRFVKPGQVEWYYSQGNPDFDAEGKLIGYSGSSFDITSRRIAEEGLRESEERFRLISSVTTDYTYSSRVNAEGEVEQGLLTGAFESITGYTPQEFVARGGWQPIVHPDEWAVDEQHLEALRHNQRVDYETRIIRKDGQMRYVRVYGIPIWDEVQERLVGIYGAVQDINKRKLAEEALRQSEARFRAIFEGASVGVVVTDRQGTNVAANPAFENLVGYTADELRQITFKDITHPDDVQLNLDLFEQFLNGEVDQYQLEKRYLHKDGSVIPVRLNASRFPGEANSDDFLIVHVEDITEIKQAQARQIELAIAIERARADVLKEFLGSASHDLRTPLTIMNTSLYLLRKTSESEKQLTYIDRLEAQTQHIHRLIESLFTLSRLDLGEAEFSFAECDVNLVVQQVIDQQRPLVQSKQHTVILDSSPDTLWITADAGELREALRHVLVNACNYTPDGGQIFVKTFRHDGGAMIEVRDTGIGISDAELPLIFERFYRADQARQVATGAAGLGLTITRKIIEAHQGEISAESVVGKGSTFRICLPLRAAAPRNP